MQVYPPTASRWYANQLEGNEPVQSAWTKSERCWDLLPVFMWDMRLYESALTQNGVHNGGRHSLSPCIKNECFLCYVDVATGHTLCAGLGPRL